MNNNSKKRFFFGFLLGVAITVPCALFLFPKGEGKTVTTNQQPQAETDSVPVETQTSAEPAFIVIDKQTMTLQLYDIKGQRLMKVGIACGKNFGNKQRPGDLRTPEGVFSVEAIQDASSWTHDFKDGKGEIAGAYGHWFIRLRCPGHSGIGIHGTHDPSSIGTRCTEGCVRLLNENLDLLKEKVYPGMVVIILPSTNDVQASGPDAGTK